jgi:hypothetical protein
LTQIAVLYGYREVREGEQLLGGGYYMLTDPSNIGFTVVATASYPSDDLKSWIVEFFNPDQNDQGPNMDT